VKLLSFSQHYKEEKEDENSIHAPGCRHEVKERVLKTTICNLCSPRSQKYGEKSDCRTTTGQRSTLNKLAEKGMEA
jgi:hypothetical protein